MTARVDALHTAQALFDAERFVDAERLYRQIVAQNPTAAAINGLGITLAKQGQLTEAEPLFRRAIQMEPRYLAAYQNLARCCKLQEHLAEAEQVYRAMIQVWPNDPANYDNVGWMLRDQKKYREGIPFLETAIRMQPDNADFHYHLGLLYNDLYELDGAMSALKPALAIDPDHRASRRELAVVLWRQKRFSEAMAQFDLILEADPQNIEALQGQAELRLLLGDYERGWRGYECRWEDPAFSELKFIKKYRPNGFPMPRWKSEDIAGKTLLLYGEQGFGDVIQFIRYVPLLKQRGARCVLQVPFPLKTLLEHMPGIDRILVHGEKDVPHDYYAALMSLPAIFGTTLSTVPAEIPYLRVPEKIRAAWQRQMAEYDGGLKVGLCWAGRPDHYNDARRSSALKHFAPLAKVPNVKFFSLQKGPAASQSQSAPPGMNLINLSHRLSDFADTAGLIEQLDLVISIDTSVVHLAGALGKPVWTMLPFLGEWRWMLDRSDSPWYPTMRLFRQKTRDDWDGIFTEAAEELQKLAAAASSTAGIHGGILNKYAKAILDSRSAPGRVGAAP